MQAVGKDDTRNFTYCIWHMNLVAIAKTPEEMCHNLDRNWRTPYIRALCSHLWGGNNLKKRVIWIFRAPGNETSFWVPIGKRNALRKAEVFKWVRSISKSSPPPPHV
ncbi:hypothetical protein FRX31_023223 [Thalictrum thalictroides]|uniref:Uncharacterized protein n=1 Tax=Thalictrum thalictroides TaxID=46969 RepID=A0A7J6VRH9_THATH|nr:hypothetical protein FRX31_023223 [Thalictrum thalictroides]